MIAQAFNADAKFGISKYSHRRPTHKQHAC